MTIETATSGASVPAGQQVTFTATLATNRYGNTDGRLVSFLRQGGALAGELADDRVGCDIRWHATVEHWAA